MERRLVEQLQALQPLAIAFSGGLDSAVLAMACKRNSIAARLVHIQTFLQTSRELTMMRQLTEQLALPLESIPVDLTQAPFLKDNPPDRCYHCKKLIFSTIRSILPADCCLVDGTQADDLDEERPGARAAKELGVLSPLKTAGLGKKELRELAKAWGLPNWSTPAASCLATRVPFGVSVTPENTQIIDDAENRMLVLGYPTIRIRMELKQPEG